MTKSVPLMLCMVLYLCGCGKVEDFGTSLKHNIQGEYYLYKQDFKQGRETFEQAAQKDQENPEAQYYYGRFLLAENDATKALPYLKQATVLAPDKSEYYFWLGIAYGESGQGGLERKSYTKTLEIDPKNIQALTYMGNSHLRAKKYTTALGYYHMALELSYENPQALYNKAIALRKLGRSQEEKFALIDYITACPAGSYSRLATDRLNSLGDYTYRNHRLGFRTVTLAEIVFIPSSDKLSDSAYPSLDLVGETVVNIQQGTLDIVVYCLNNNDLAKQRAISIKDYLATRFPALEVNQRIRMSWFDSAEKQVVLRKTRHIDESVQFFLTEFKG